MRFRTRRPYYFKYQTEQGRGFMFGVLYKHRTVQAYGERGERLMLRGWFYYVTSDGRLHYDITPKGRISYKSYFVTSANALKKHQFLKYKEFQKLLILFGPEIKKAAPNAGEEIPTPEAT